MFDVSGLTGGSLRSSTVTFNITLCFARGTRIATPWGETLVEGLKIGDVLRTPDGREVDIKWIGTRTMVPMFNPADRLEPVVIRKGALGENVPHSDLVVTADHGMIIDGMVINASALVNGRDIHFLEYRALGRAIEYFHIETENHDAILANGAASETYLDIPGRQFFDNHAQYTALYGPETAITEMKTPRITSAQMLPQTLRDRFGIQDDAVQIAI